MFCDGSRLAAALAAAGFCRAVRLCEKRRRRGAPSLFTRARLIVGGGCGVVGGFRFFS